MVASPSLQLVDTGRLISIVRTRTVDKLEKMSDEGAKRLGENLLMEVGTEDLSSVCKNGPPNTCVSFHPY